MMGVMSERRQFSLGAVILAAGSSSRMGQPKMLMPWEGTTVLGHLIARWTDLAAQVAVVRAASDAGIEEELNRLKFSVENRITNCDTSRGMFSSIRCAAEWDGWKRGLTHWAIVLGDQPHLRAATLKALIDFAKRHPGKICQPSREGHGRHPVLLPRAVFNKLRGSEHETLKEFLQLVADDVRLVELDDTGLDVDIDRPADYERARKM
jgi:molybdenum cofactor cytidylyltransferase